jgi:hypothetical protein
VVSAAIVSAAPKSNDAVAVRVIERLAAFENDLDHLADRQHGFGLREGLEGAALDKFHHQVTALLVRDRVEDRNDVGMG